MRTPVYAAEPDDIWDGTTAGSFESGTGTEGEPYIIVNGEQLALLSAIINSTGSEYITGIVTYSVSYCRAAYYCLGADIVLNDTVNWENWGEEDGNGNTTAPANSWTAIGMKTMLEDFRFNGRFNGNNHTVSGIYIKTDGNLQGLFGYTGYSALITNLGVTDSYIKGVNEVGGIAGYMDYGTISNCYNSGIIDGSSEVGGIAGYNSGNQISNCCNAGNVSGNISVGGIAGGVHPQADACGRRALFYPRAEGAGKQPSQRPGEHSSAGVRLFHGPAAACGGTHG
jgi:hypothetical protein